MNSLVNIAALTVTLVAVILSIASCDQASFFEPSTSYEGSNLKLTVEEIVRVGQTVYAKDTEANQLLFLSDDTSGSDFSLLGPAWTLVSISVIDALNWPGSESATNELVYSAIPEVDVTMKLMEGGELRGNAGCNDYFSSQYHAKDGIFDAGVLFATERVCEAATGIMEQESRFLELLAAAESYVVGHHLLKLTVPGSRKNYVIWPQSEDNELVALGIHLENNASFDVQLDMNALPAELRMDTGRYHSVDINDARMPAEGFRSALNEYVPLIRDFHFLDKGSELEGWLIFDVPKGSKAESFKWEAGGDIIIIDFE